MQKTYIYRERDHTDTITLCADLCSKAPPSVTTGLSAESPRAWLLAAREKGSLQGRRRKARALVYFVLESEGKGGQVRGYLALAGYEASGFVYGSRACSLGAKAIRVLLRVGGVC